MLNEVEKVEVDNLNVNKIDFSHNKSWVIRLLVQVPVIRALIEKMVRDDWEDNFI